MFTNAKTEIEKLQAQIQTLQENCKDLEYGKEKQLFEIMKLKFEVKQIEDKMESKISILEKEHESELALTKNRYENSLALAKNEANE
jgi:peptidoglycan hydrolase CwlO-like protein